MNIYQCLMIAVFLFVLSNCKNKTDEAIINEDKVVLKEALTIQDEAIHIGMVLDSLIDGRMAQGNISQDVESLKKWKSKVNDWKYNMVAIPGFAHDHAHDDHAGHEHAHNHTSNDVGSLLKPEDIKKVQIEWKSAIEAIRDSLQ